MTLFERSGTLGGQVARQHVGGVDLDAAAESFATRGGAVAALLHELGLGDDIVTPRPSPAWLHRVDGTAVPLPATSVMGIPGDPLAARRHPRDRPPWCVASPARSGFSRRAGERMPRPSASSCACAWGAPWPTASWRPVVRGVHSTDDRRAPGRTRPPSAPGRAAASAVRSPPPSGPFARRLPPVRRSPASGAACSGSSTRWSPTARDSASRSNSAPTSRSPVRTASSSADAATAGSSFRAQPAADPAAAVREVTLVTLVVEAPALDAAPRGTGRARRPGCSRRPCARAHAPHARSGRGSPRRCRGGTPCACRTTACPTTRSLSRRRMPASSSARRSIA